MQQIAGYLFMIMVLAIWYDYDTRGWQYMFFAFSLHY